MKNNAIYFAIRKTATIKDYIPELIGGGLGAGAGLLLNRYLLSNKDLGSALLSGGVGAGLGAGAGYEYKRWRKYRAYKAKSDAELERLKQALFDPTKPHGSDAWFPDDDEPLPSRESIRAAKMDPYGGAGITVDKNFTDEDGNITGIGAVDSRYTPYEFGDRRYTFKPLSQMKANSASTKESKLNDSILDIPTDSILDIPTDSILDIPTDSILDW